MDPQVPTNSAYGKRPLWQWIVLYAIIGAVVYGVIYFLFFNKNGYSYNSGSQYNVAPVSKNIAPSQVMAQESTVTLAAQNNSGESGTATLKEENGAVTVTVSLTGFAPGVSQPAHVHSGSCPGVGEVKYALNPVLDGKSTTLLKASLAEIKKQGPLLAINVHKSQKAIETYTACGMLDTK